MKCRENEQAEVCAAGARTKMVSKLVGSDDGVGALPDEVLQHVLSFLPAREAVQTCVLARRWRHLWKSMPALRVSSADDGWKLRPQDAKNLNGFVNNLLLLRDSRAQLDFCEFYIDHFEAYHREPEVSLWVQKALLCKARILRVEFAGADDFLMLDNFPLISQHLTTLELRCVTLEGKFLDFSSCPALKNLWMRCCWINAEKISSQSVKQMTIIGCVFNRNIRTRISAPSVVRLKLTDNYDRTPLLESMPSLVKAFVRLHSCEEWCGKEDFGGSCSYNSCGNCGGGNYYGNRRCVLLKGLSKAESLELIAEPGMFTFKRDLMWCPTFTNLKTLLLNEWCVAKDFRALICFLQHTPVLEKLILQLSEMPDNWVETKGSCNPSNQPFASKKLKTIDVKCEIFDKRVHKIFRILSTYGVYLEEINFERTARCSERYSFQIDEDIYR